MDATPIPIRAHSVLCLLGFRGEGYSPAFVARMQDLQDRLKTDPRQQIRLLATPGTLCAACPHLEGGCTLQGPDHEAHMHAQDEDVLTRLGLEAGDVRTWAELLPLVHAHLQGTDLQAICSTCPWLSLGWCREGLDGLGQNAP